MHDTSELTGFELSVNQKDIWSLSDDINNYYNQIVITIKGPVNDERLAACIDTIVKRHDVLSSKLAANTSSQFPVQVLSKEVRADFNVMTVSPTPFQDLYHQVNNRLSAPYNPLFNEPARFCLVHVSDQEHYLFTRLYSLWGDSYSCTLLYNDLYNEYCNAAQEPANNEVIVYRNFSQWQNDLVNNPESEGVAYWKEFNLSLQSGLLPFGNRKPSPFAPGKLHIASLAGEKYSDLSHQCAALNTSTSNLLLTSFCAYLANFMQNEVLVGYTPFKRNFDVLNNTLGLVSKVLPVKINAGDLKNFGELTQHTAKMVDEVMEWGDYFRLERADTRDSMPSPSFPCCFEYIEMPARYHQPGSATGFSLTEIYSVTDLFLIKLFCIDYGDELRLELYYDKNKLDAREIAIIASQLQALFEANFMKTPGEFLLAEKEMALIAEYNTTGNSFNIDKTIIELIEEQALRSAGKTALIDEGRRVSFKQLKQHYDRMADQLQRVYNIQPGDRVGVLMQRSQMLVITLLAIMKSGAVYVPIDPAYPQDRITYILRDCDAALLVTENELANEKQLNEMAINIHYASEEAVAEEDFSAPPACRAQPGSLAYIIYTSGSTGNPKGCMITHKNLSNYLQWASDYYYKDRRGGNCALITSVSFDLSVTCLYLPLIRGKKLVLGDPSKDIARLLKEMFNDPAVDTIKLTPSHLSLLNGLDITDCHISTVICGGEQLTWEQVKILWKIKNDIRVYNEYGPTETTVGSIVKEIQMDEEKILIGRPVANTEIYLLNNNAGKVLVGALGEIVIAGQGVGAGYFNQPGLSQEKFRPNPFEKNGLIYSTGDLGRLLPNGSIEYAGRKDDQLKINGYRIEPTEIETLLLKYPGINAVAVAGKTNGLGEIELIAYLVSEQVLHASDLRIFLSMFLPTYMLPSHFIPLATLPLTPNGKVDKKNLPGPESWSKSAGAEYVAARNETEEKLVKIWEEILGTATIGINDNFFDLGGNSIKLIKMVSMINKLFDNNLTVVMALKYPSVAALSHYLQFGEENGSGKLEANLQESTAVMEETLRLLN